MSAHLVSQEAGAAPKILLAPMEGLLDCVLRDVLTRLGGVDACVAEFIRVTDTLLPKRTFIRVMPELLNGGKTPAGTPVVGQLLGSDPNWLAENARRFALLGPAGIDLNFGCPAKLVNRHGGGAMLLKDPELMFNIVQAVRKAVPVAVPVTGKMRLGYMDDSRAEECALAIQEGGAAQIVVHARTKADGYRPPAHWHRIADLRKVLRVPLVANGEIWSLADALRCQSLSGCSDLMLGRGIVADPGLAWALRASFGRKSSTRIAGIHSVCWDQVAALLPLFWERVSQRVVPKHRAGRLKQWLNLLRRTYPQAQKMFDDLRELNESHKFDRYLADFQSQKLHQGQEQLADAL